jgi:hypothetical protein
MFEDDDRAGGDWTILEAERSVSDVAGGGSARQSNWMKVDAPSRLLAPPHRGEQPTAEPRERPAPEQERPAADPKERPAPP